MTAHTETTEDDNTTTEPVDQDQLTRAQKALLALSNDVATQLAEDHGVCVRPLAMRRIDTTTGRVDVVPVPCGSTREDQCRPCSEKARRLRMAQCREGWHLEHEPLGKPADPTEAQKNLMATRADLHAAYQRAREDGDDRECEEIRETVAEIDQELRALGVRGHGSPRSTRNQRPCAAPPAVGRTRRTCPVGRWRTAPSGGCSAASTGPQRS